MVNQCGDDQKPSNNVNIEQDKRRKKLGKQQLKARIDKVMRKFLLISLVKYALQNLRRPKKKNDKKRKECMEEQKVKKL